MDFVLRVKMAVYGHFAETGRRPAPAEVAARAGGTAAEVIDAWRELRSRRLLVLEQGDDAIRMAPPFSGVPTQHVVESGGISYHANCAWDALGVAAALGRAATVRSRCEQSREPFVLQVEVDGPGASDWLFHCLVPASKWWEDIVFT